MKSYSDLEQSMKLAEILPLESADMYWFRDNIETPRIYPEDMMKNSVSVTCPCWSLAALLRVLPYPELREQYNGNWTCKVSNAATTFLWEDDSPIDACVAMVEKLHEQKLL